MHMAPALQVSPRASSLSCSVEPVVTNASSFTPFTSVPFVWLLAGGHQDRAATEPQRAAPKRKDTSPIGFDASGFLCGGADVSYPLPNIESFAGGQATAKRVRAEGAKQTTEQEDGSEGQSDADFDYWGVDCKYDDVRDDYMMEEGRCEVIEEVRCEACDHTAKTCPGALGRPCRFFGQRKRRQDHADSMAKTRAEVAAEVDASKAPLRLVEGTVEIQSGAGLECFYNSMVAGLKKLEHACAPVDARQLRIAIAGCLHSSTASTLVCESGDTLLEWAAKEKTTLKEMADAVQGLRGAIAGMGGTELLPVVSHLYSVAITTCRATHL